MRKTMLSLLGAGLVISLIARAAPDEAAEPADGLAAQVRALQLRVHRLEQRVAELEQKRPPQSILPAPDRRDSVPKDWQRRGDGADWHYIIPLTPAPQSER